eukprot:PhF_6_TR14153/c0_g1_i1/m.22640
MHRQSWKVQSEEMASNISAREWKSTLLMLEDVSAFEPQKVEEITTENQRGLAVKEERDRVRRERASLVQREREEKAMEVEILSSVLSEREELLTEELHRIAAYEEKVKAEKERCDKRDAKWEELVRGKRGTEMENRMARELELTLQEEEMELLRCRLSCLSDSVSAKEKRIVDKEQKLEHLEINICRREERLKLREEAVSTTILGSGNPWLQDVLSREHAVLLEETLLEDRMNSFKSDIAVQLHDISERSEELRRREIEVNAIRQSLISKVKEVDAANKAATEYISQYQIGLKTLEIQQGDIRQARLEVTAKEAQLKEKENDLNTQLWYISHFRKNFPTADVNIFGPPALKSEERSLSPIHKEILEVQITPADEFVIEEAAIATSSIPKSPEREALRVPTKTPRAPRPGATPRHHGFTPKSGLTSPKKSPHHFDSKPPPATPSRSVTPVSQPALSLNIPTTLITTPAVSPAVMSVPDSHSFTPSALNLSPSVVVAPLNQEMVRLEATPKHENPPPPQSQSEGGSRSATPTYRRGMDQAELQRKKSELRNRLLNGLPASPANSGLPSTAGSESQSFYSDDISPRNETRWQIMEIHGKTYYVHKHTGEMQEWAPDDIAPLDPEMKLAVEEHKSNLVKRREENVFVREKQVQALVTYLQSQKINSVEEESKLKDRLARVARLEGRLSRAVEALRQPLPETKPITTAPNPTSHGSGTPVGVRPRFL